MGPVIKVQLFRVYFSLFIIVIGNIKVQIFRVYFSLFIIAIETMNLSRTYMF
jgi:hypothetical protein